MPIDGIKIGISLRFGGDQGLQIADLSGGPITDERKDELPDHMVPGNALPPAAVLGLTAAGTMGLGMLMRGLEGKQVITLKDLLLDAGVGAGLGCGLIGGPIAESLFLNGFFTLPMAGINAVNDPSSDWRLSLIVGGVLGLGKDALGHTIIPLAGWSNDERGTFRFSGSELFANALTDIAVTSSFFALSNGVTALLEGKPGDLGERLKVGAIYGGALGLAESLFIGPPMQADSERLKNGIALYGQYGGPDLNDVKDWTTFRAGVVGGGAITLGRFVRGSETMFDRDSVWGHELVHRDQMAGSRERMGPGVVREGLGSLSFYTQYILWALEYPAMTGDPPMHAHPFEREAYRQMPDEPDRLEFPGGAVIGQYVGGSLGLGGFALFSHLLQPDEK